MTPKHRLPALLAIALATGAMPAIPNADIPEEDPTKGTTPQDQEALEKARQKRERKNAKRLAKQKPTEGV